MQITYQDGIFIRQQNKNPNENESYNKWKNCVSKRQGKKENNAINI